MTRAGVLFGVTDKISIGCWSIVAWKFAGVIPVTILFSMFETPTAITRRLQASSCALTACAPSKLKTIVAKMRRKGPIMFGVRR